MTINRTCPQCDSTKPILDFYFEGRRYLAACASCRKKEVSSGETRKCRHCHKSLPIADFRKRGNGRRTWFCRSCDRIRQQKYDYPEDPNETSRVCRQCGEHKPIDRFTREKRAQGGRAVTCKDCRKNRAPRRRTDPLFELFGISFTDGSILHRQGRFRLTAPEIYQLLLGSEGVCAICGFAFKDNTDVHIDHNHKTECVRGVLCRSCNHLLGACKENPEVLVLASLYLAKHKE